MTVLVEDEAFTSPCSCGYPIGLQRRKRYLVYFNQRKEPPWVGALRTSWTD